MFNVYVVLFSLFLVVSTSAIDYLERLVSETIYYVSSGTLNCTHSLADHKCINQFIVLPSFLSVSAVSVMGWLPVECSVYYVCVEGVDGV